MRALQVLSCVLLMATVVRGEDDAALAYAQRVATFPVPSTAHECRYAGRVLLDGKNVGTFRLEATAQGDTSPEWVVRDRVRFEEDLAPGMGGVSTATAKLTQGFALVQGSLEQRTGTRHGWRVGKDGFTFVTTARDGTRNEQRVRHSKMSLTTVSALVLFGRLALPHKATYATSVMNPARMLFEPATLEAGTQGTWEGDDALLLVARKGRGTFTLAFDPDSRALLGARLEEGFTMSFVPHGAPDARSAALKAGFALATSDVERIDRIAHWPSLHAAHQTGDPDGKAASVSQFRRDRLVDFEGRTGEPAAMMRSAIKVVAPQLQIERHGADRATVRFPAMFRSLVVDVGRHEGIWYLVKFPAAPTPPR